MAEEKKLGEEEFLGEIERDIALSPEDKLISETEKEIKNIAALLEELKKYEFYKSKFLKLHDEIFLRYQKGEYNFIQYERKINKLLGGKSKKEVVESYQTAIYNILKRIDLISANIFMLYYNDKPERKATTKKIFFKPKEVVVESVPATLPTTTTQIYKEKQKKPLGEQKEIDIEIPKPIEAEVKEDKIEKKKEKLSALEKKELNIPIPQPLRSKKKKESWFLRLLHKINEIKKHEEIKTKPELTTTTIKTKKPKIVFEGKNKISKKEKLKPGEIISRGPSIFGSLFKRKKFESVEDTKLTKSAYYFKTGEEAIIPKEELDFDRAIKVSPELLTEEARRIRKLMGTTKKGAIYNPSSIGYVANSTVSKISFFLLDKFPDFFKRLYLNLKLANIRMLSNTYINIMVFFSIISFILGFILSFINALSDGLPFLGGLVNGLSTALISGIIAFALIYMYPSMKISDRRRSINANLTFAIDHMSAIAGSGIVPVKMFKLLSESKEYGEISVELEKVVEYMELFGYDLITALKSVSAVTPSDKLKEFFDGYISTIESGGNIEDYLKQKSDEAMTDYKVQRQSYTETISTYSDVYTGILIAAPLFFIATLSLVNMLGGSVGGLDVEKLIVFGTYVVIPFLNILFLIFLQLTQPEI